MSHDATIALLERFSQAWNDHDVDAILSCMTDDCVYLAAAGTTAEGERFIGKVDVGRAFTAIWTRMPDAEWAQATHFTDGASAISKWLFRGTPTGSDRRIEMMGIDVFTLRNGLIAVKDTYRKARTP